MRNHYDYIIVGSGIAGLYTALLASEQGRVLLLTKGSLDECNTKYAQGGIAAAISAIDSPELHIKDTLAVGAGLCDPEAVSIIAFEAADRIQDLIRLGVPFDTVEGQIALAQEGGHSVPRILHAGGDATGAQIEQTMSSLVRSSGVTIKEHHLAVQIQVKQDTFHGIAALDCQTGEIREFWARFLILATGGAGRLFARNTNPEVATGDGIALAYKAGVEITDIEFVQFHPTALYIPGTSPFLLSEAIRGEGGILIDDQGKRFMFEYHEQGELAPRDVVTRAMLREMDKSGRPCVFLDVSHLPPSKVAARFPSIFRFCLQQGIDITKTPIPIAPAAHYIMGGIRTNSWGETNIQGLFACGEVACTGVHGANRLASNSLLEVLVFAQRIIERTRDHPELRGTFPTNNGYFTSLEPSPKIMSDQTRKPSFPVLQSLLWDAVGITRNRESLQKARSILAQWERDLPPPTQRWSYELANGILAGRLMTEAAFIREESRGAHFRQDFPHESPSWLRHIIFRQNH